MTCEHVLGLIDAGPFADYPAAHLDAAWTHARRCPTCGPALAAASALTSSLAALPQPGPPADLARQVMSQVMRLEEPSVAASPEQTVTAGSRRFEWRGWATLFGALSAGLSMILAAQTHGFTDGMASITLARTTPGLAPLPSSGGEMVALVAGVVLYLLGLFGPARGGKS